MNNYITITDSFNTDIIDNDPIISSKIFFNIYNNSIEEPFHKFWFNIENAKLINIYTENNIYRFAINNKIEKNKKVMDYLKNTFDYIQKLFIKVFPDITIEYPWKENENYPYLINFFSTNNTIFIDSKENDKNIANITKDNNYSIFFELTYIQVVKITLNNQTNNSLRVKLSLIMIQEKDFNIKNILLYKNVKSISQTPSLNCLNSLNSLNSFNSLKDTNHIQNKVENINIKNLQTPAKIFNLSSELLLNKMKSLNKINPNPNENDIDKEHKDNENSKYLEQKNKLKKVETDEKSFVQLLKKEHELLKKEKENEEKINIDSSLIDVPVIDNDNPKIKKKKIKNKINNEIINEINNEIINEQENKQENPQ
jgi:hypothetical protein